MRVKFHDPYHPNDGHVSGERLPWDIYGYLKFLEGTTGDLEAVLKILNDLNLGYVFEDHGDYICVTYQAGQPHPIYHWLGIRYTPIEEPSHV